MSGPAPGGVTREIEPYGDGELRRGEWWRPSGDRPLPTVMLVHGGYWGPCYDRSLEDSVAADLAGRGFAVWNVDYSAADRPWPQTLLDVAAAHDHLADDPGVGTLSLVGHSAGGQLALWLASRRHLPHGAPGAGPRGPAPALVVGQAPVAALRAGFRQDLGDGAIGRLLGGSPDELPDRYAVADPVALAPSGARVLLLHSHGDEHVPYSQSEAYAKADPQARLTEVPGDHFTHLDPASDAWSRALEALDALPTGR